MMMAWINLAAVMSRTLRDDGGFVEEKRLVISKANYLSR